MPRRVIVWVGILSLIAVCSARAQPPSVAYCVLLDHYDEPVWSSYAGHVDRSRGDGFKSLGQWELGAHTGLFYAHTAFGEWDLRGGIDSIFFTGKGQHRLPDHLAAVRLDVDGTWRLAGDNALRLGFAPGFYSEIHKARSDHLFYPFRVHGIRAFTGDLSGLLGMDFYPGFDRWYNPRLGVRWMISDFLMLDAFYPKTEMVFRPAMAWTTRIGMEFEEVWEYRLKSRDDRKGLRMKGTRIYAGVEYEMINQVAWILQIGRMVDRSMQFRRNYPTLEINDAYFIRFGLGGML